MQKTKSPHRNKRRLNIFANVSSTALTSVNEFVNGMIKKMTGWLWAPSNKTTNFGIVQVFLSVNIAINAKNAFQTEGL